MSPRSKSTGKNHSQITESNYGWFQRTDEKISEFLTYVLSFTSAEHIFNQPKYLPLMCKLETQLLGYLLWQVSILNGKLDCTTYTIITHFQN